MRVQLLGCLLLALHVAACGCGVSPVSGGSSGTIRMGETPLSDIQVTVHRLAGDRIETIGFGVSGPDGKFALVRNGAAGPLWLSPGEYRCTVESVGPVPVRFPQVYGQAGTTPFKVEWVSSDQELELELPSLVPGR
jgi:hypothetical protein